MGTPGQTVRLLPGTSASAGDTTWVVIDEGCTVANPNLTNCGNERGSLFHRSNSTSWSTQRLTGGGLYSLNTFEESYLGLGGNAYYGFETINLGLPGSGMPTVSNQVVAGFGTNDFWLGSLGLSPIPFNFTDLNDPQPSLLSTLRNESLIPSLSWAYTAGAHYQDPPVYGSLTLGGYDTTRFRENNVTLAFGADFSRDLLVKLQSITYNTLGSSPLLTSGIDMFIDSMVTNIYLPLDVCRAFEQAFNLTWNATADMYVLDEATHDSLLAQNPTFTFTLSNGSSTVDIVFPYAAFDLNATQSLVGSDVRYFPLKQAQNSSQYTLGRVFLQEAYVVADYSRQNFSVSQALFPGTSIAQNLVTILPPGAEVEHDKSKNISSGAIAGIAIAAVAVLGLVVGLVVWSRRRAKRRQAEEKELADRALQSGGEKASAAAAVREMHELDDRETMVRELDGWQSARTELQGDQAKDGVSGRYELRDPVKVHEMGGGNMPAVELEAPLR